MRAFGLGKVSLFYGAMILGAVALLGGPAGVGRLLPAPTSGAWAWSAVVGGAVGLGLVVVSRLVVRRFDWGARLASEFRTLLGDLDARHVVAMAVLSAVAEELLFRGVLVPAVGVWVASAVFAALHVGPSARFAAWTLMALVAGLVLGELFVRTGNVFAPIVAHATVNYLNLRFLTRPSARAQLGFV